MISNWFDGNKKQPSLGSYDPKLGFYHIYMYAYLYIFPGRQYSSFYE